MSYRTSDRKKSSSRRSLDRDSPDRSEADWNSGSDRSLDDVRPNDDSPGRVCGGYGGSNSAGGSAPRILLPLRERTISYSPFTGPVSGPSSRLKSSISSAQHYPGQEDSDDSDDSGPRGTGLPITFNVL